MTILDSGTIVAVATPEGCGGLAVVRLSGPRAVAIARRMLPGAELGDPIVSHLARLGIVCWPATDVGLAAGAAIDQVLVLPMLAPASYTGEDTVEFHCHGGAVPARQIVDACRSEGARAALPGEFTRRAFVNGKLSLTQAEAVADLIAAEHPAAAQAALAQLRGGLNRDVARIERILRPVLAALEGSLEFGDDLDANPPDRGARLVALTDARLLIGRLLALRDTGRRLREGVQVVFRGPPNVGKSSLFNALLGQPRALVDHEPGTTRDVVSAPLMIDGILFMLHDTAGLRDVAGGVEAMGIERARQQAASADIVLDLKDGLSGKDGWSGKGPAAAIDRAGGDGGSPIVLTVWTKCDQGGDAAGLATSAVTGRGLDELRESLVARVRTAGLDAAVKRGVVLSDRHVDRLRSCDAVLASLISQPDLGEEIISSMLAAALQDLGSISGRVFNERLLDEVFARFCVGK